MFRYFCEGLSNYKNDLMVIIAGYEDELNNTFFVRTKDWNHGYLEIYYGTI